MIMMVGSRQKMPTKIKRLKVKMNGFWFGES